MKAVLTGMCVALGLTAAAFGQQAPPSPGSQQRPTAAPQGSQSGEQVTVTGCVQREADYRRARDAGRGGVAGTGVGAGNEFILAEVSASPAGTARAEAGAPAAGAPAPTGTTGTGTTAYELTGSNEGQVAQYVGRRVEIMGRLKPAEAGAGGTTGGPTAGAPPRGVDATSKDLQLRELELTSVRETSGTCAAARP